MANKLNLDTIIVITFYFVLIGVVGQKISILFKPPMAFEEKRTNEDVRLPSFTLVSNDIVFLIAVSFRPQCFISKSYD